MGEGTPKNPITLEEAQQLVQSFHDRVRRIGYTSEKVPAKFNTAMFGTVAVGALLTTAAFLPSISLRTRLAAAGGAFLSAGAATLLATTAYIARQTPSSIEMELAPFIEALEGSKQLRAEMAEYIAGHVSREEFDMPDQGDATMMRHACAFGRQKGLVAAAMRNNNAATEDWVERAINSGTGKQILLSGSFS
jgi:hypothetical protein